MEVSLVATIHRHFIIGAVSKCIIHNIIVLIVVAIVIPIVLNNVVISVMSLFLVVVNDVDYSLFTPLQVCSSKFERISIITKPELRLYCTKPPIWVDLGGLVAKICPGSKCHSFMVNIVQLRKTWRCLTIANLDRQNDDKVGFEGLPLRKTSICRARSIKITKNITK